MFSNFLNTHNRNRNISHARLRIQRYRKAFSLMEIMVVLVIMGLLASVVTINVRAYLVKGRQTVAKQDIRVICDALDSFYATSGRYPTNDEGLAALTKATESMSEALLNPTNLKDPWKNPYQYNCPAAGSDRPFEVISLGSDFAEGGEKEAADISSNDLE